MHDGERIAFGLFLETAHMSLIPSRLSLAVDEGLSLPDAGRIVVYRPRAGYDLSALPRAQVSVVQGFFPDHQAFAQAGFDTDVRFEGEAAMAVVVVPRAKDEARALIAEAAAQVGSDGIIVVDGQKTDGVDSLWKALRKRGEILGAQSKAHGRIFWFRGLDLADWAAAPSQTGDGFLTAPGVFSADGADKGSVLLGEALPQKLPPRVCDLGAGWGYLAAPVLARKGVVSLDLVEAEHAALEAARVNVTDPRAEFIWEDARHLSGRSYDLVISNPPFHTTRTAEPDLGRAFIASAARLLTQRGELWLVANRHLGYEATLGEHFRDYSEIAGTNAFKVLRATRPTRKTRTR